MRRFLGMGVFFLAVGCGGGGDGSSLDGSSGSESLGGEAGLAGFSGVGGETGGAGGVANPNTVNDGPNCTSVVDSQTTQCDAQHTQVVTCMTPEAIPSYATCVAAVGVDRGLVWCCEP